MPKAVQPLIAAYIRDNGHKQQFRDGNFTLTNSAGLTVSPLVWPAGVFPGTETFLHIEAHSSNGVVEAQSQNQLIENQIDQACNVLAARVEEALSQLRELDRRVDALQQTIHERTQMQHQVREQEERLRITQWEAQDRERELERDRRARDRDSETDKRQREREHTQELMERARPLIVSHQDSARSRSADLAVTTDLRALKDQVREMSTTIERACGEGIMIHQSVPICRRRKLICLRYFACRTPVWRD